LAAEVCPTQYCCITVWGPGNAPTQALNVLPCSFEVLYFSTDAIVTGRCNVLVQTTNTPLFRSTGCLCDTTTFPSITGDVLCDNTPVCVVGGSNGFGGLDIGVTQTASGSCTQVSSCECSTSATATSNPCCYTQSNLRLGVCASVTNTTERAGGMAIDPSGNAFVVSEGTTNSQIYKITPTGVCSYFGAYPGTEYSPNIISDASGNLYAGSCKGNDQIYKFSPSGTCTIAFSNPTNHYCCITSVAINPLNGNLIFVSKSTNEVVEFDGTTCNVILNAALAAQYAFSKPFDVTTDSAGNIFVGTDCNDQGGSNNIFKITPGGVISQIFENALYGATVQSLITDPSGNLYAASFSQSRAGQNVFKITPAGVCSVILDQNGDGTDFFAQPVGLSLDSQGNLYIAGEYSQSVIKITPSGQKIQIIDASAFGIGVLNTPTSTGVDPISGDIIVLGEDSQNVFRICSD